MAIYLHELYIQRILSSQRAKAFKINLPKERIVQDERVIEKILSVQ